jgi:tetratricopeptide (TPR) repeat protein
MIGRWVAILSLILLSSSFCPGATGKPAPESSEIVAARKARDRADVSALRAAIEAARKDVSQSQSFDAYRRLALFSHWMVEVSHVQNNKSLGKRSADEGIDAASQAVRLNAGSSEAHALLGELYGEAIPFTFMGGMRYGSKSDRELEKAVELDPKNAEAHMGLGLNKMFAPAAFGGSLPQAIEHLKKAVELDPSSDTAHAWLAQAYERVHQHEQALGEIEQALRLNPERRWLGYVQSQIGAAKKK